MKKDNERLKAENNLLQLKVDILIDLVGKTKQIKKKSWNSLHLIFYKFFLYKKMAKCEADRQILENENDQLKTRLRK